MSRWLPYPLLSLGLLLMWLALNQTLAPAHLLLGGVIAVVGGLTLAKLNLPPTHAKRPKAFILLMAKAFADVVRSNVAVIRIILFPPTRGAVSGFVRIPLEMRSPYGLAILGGIITAAPGTCWVDYESDTGILMIHVLDLIDESEWVDTIKMRYERLLMEIFE